MTSHVSKSQPRTPNQLEDIASDILWFFFKKNTVSWTEWASPLKPLAVMRPRGGAGPVATGVLKIKLILFTSKNLTLKLLGIRNSYFAGCLTT